MWQEVIVVRLKVLSSEDNENKKRDVPDTTASNPRFVSI
jgi:hypothetical protein